MKLKHQASTGGRSILMAAISFAGIGVALIGAAAAGLVADAGGFFGAGTALLVAFLCLFVFWFGRPVRKVLGPRRLVASFSLGIAQRDVSAGSKHVIDRYDRLGHFHSDLGGRLP